MVNELTIHLYIANNVKWNQFIFIDSLNDQSIFQ